MEKKIKTALAAYGMSGQVFHGPSLKVSPGFEVVQVLERSKQLSKGLFPDASIVQNYDEILKNPLIELVIINTPDHLHFEMAREAIDAGKHVVVEKPATQKSRQAEELLKLAGE